MELSSNYKHSELTGQIIQLAYYVYNTLGFGFVEKVYENALAKKLKEAGFAVVHQMPINVYFEGEIVGEFVADMVVNDSVIVEFKAVVQIISKHEVQLVNYLRATEIEVGLLLNFGEEMEVKRRVFSNSLKRREGRIP